MAHAPELSGVGATRSVRLPSVAKRLAILLGIVALLAGCGDSGDGDSGDGGGAADGGAATTGIPAEIVAALGTRVVVLSSEDGTEKRTLAEGETGVSSVAVTPDRSTVYFTRADPDALCGEGAAFQVMSVPFDDGTPEVFASGSHAVVSPDGRRIAFATGGPNQCGPANLIAVQTLDSPGFSQQLIDEGGGALRPLAWAQDGRRILFEAASSPGIAPELRISDDPPPSSVVAVSGTAATFRGDRVAVAVTTGDGFRVLVQKTPPVSGFRRFLRADGSSPTTLAFDASGETVLYVADGTLARWTAGDDKPEQLAQDVIDAAWVPSPNGG